MKRRNFVLASLLACSLALLVLYAALPRVAAWVLQSLLQRQGYAQVIIRLGYPGWRALHVPLFSFQKPMTEETLTATIQDARVEYDLRTLLAGRVQRILLASVSMAWHGQRAAHGQPCAPATTPTTTPSLLAGLPMAHLARPVPVLPFHTLVIAHGQVFRECATGPLRNVRFSGTLSTDSTTTNGTLVLQGTEGPPYRLDVTVPGPGQADMVLQTEPPASTPIITVQSQLTPEADRLRLAGQARADVARLTPFLAVWMRAGAAVQQSTGTLEATWDSTAPRYGASGITGTYRLSGAVHKLPASISPVQEAQWDLPGTFVLNYPHLRGTVQAHSAVQIMEGRLADMTLPRGAMELTQDLAFRLHLETGQWTSGPAQVVFQMPHARWQDTAVTLTQGRGTLHEAHGTGDHWQGKGELHLTGLSVQHHKASMPATDWRLGIVADNTALHLDVTGTAFDQAVTFGSTLESGWTESAGTVQFHLGPLEFDPVRLPLRNILPPGAPPLDVTAGRLSAQGALTWGATPTSGQAGRVLYSGKVTLNVQQLSGTYQGMAARGVTTTLPLHVSNAAIALPEATTVTVDAVQAGIDITAVAFTVEGAWRLPASTGGVALQQIRAALLGGQASSAGLRLDTAQPHQMFTVTVEHIDLHSLFQLEQHKGLQGTGLLDGILPVVLTPAGVQVRDGRLTARPPGGVIRYVPAADATPAITQADPQLYSLMQALSNFHYNLLEIGVEYAADGTLMLKARIEGHNPDWQQGRPVHFNLTLEENIPALLKSLQIVQGLQQSIEQRFQPR